MDNESTVAYKLTDQDRYTRRGLRGETLWTVGGVVAPTGQAYYDDRWSEPTPFPCNTGVLHAYIAPEVAVLMDPIHAEYGPTARLFRIETVNGGKWHTDGLKRWTDSKVRVLEELPLPIFSNEETVAWAISMGLESRVERSSSPSWSAEGVLCTKVIRAADRAVDKPAFEQSLFRALVRARSIWAEMTQSK